MIFKISWFIYNIVIRILFIKGYKIIYDPTVKITHYKGISSGLKKHSQNLTGANSATRKRAMNAFYEAMILFYDKHYKNTYPFFGIRVMGSTNSHRNIPTLQHRLKNKMFRPRRLALLKRGLSGRRRRCR